MLATVMQVLDTTIANVALPTMTGDLGASADTINWVLTSYIVAAAIMTPVTGWLVRPLRAQGAVPDAGGRLHRHVDAVRRWRGAWRAWSLFRVLQGVFGAAIVPLSQTFLLDINPKERHGSAMAHLGRRHHGRADHRPDARRLADRELQLALGVLHQPAGRHHRLPRHGRLSAGHRQAAARLRFLRLRHAVARRRRAAADARPRRRGRLVLRRRDLDRARPGDHRLLGVHRPSADGARTRSSTRRSSPTAISSTGLVFIFVIGIILLASLALLPPMLSTHLRLSDHHHRRRHGAARRRHDDLDDRRRPHHAQGRCAAAGGASACC